MSGNREFIDDLIQKGILAEDSRDDEDEDLDNEPDEHKVEEDDSDGGA